jgi:protein ImuB
LPNEGAVAASVARRRALPKYGLVDPCGIERPSFSHNAQRATRNPFGNRQSAIGNVRPLLLTRTIASRQLIVATCEAAREAGIRPGMTLAQARAICGQVQFQEHQSQKDDAGLEALARWMMRFSPVVALDTPIALQRDGSILKLTYSGRYYNRLQAVQQKKVRADDIAVAQHGIFLDLTGCERLFHGLDNLVEQVAAALAHFGLRARLAVGETPGAAWAGTFEEESDGATERRSDEGKERSASFPSSLRRSVASSLPISSLRLTPDTLQLLHHLGVETIGQLMKLPRESLPARFGPLLSLRLDQVLGRVAEPLVPLRYVAPIEARVDFDGSVEAIEAIWLTFKELISRVVKDLVRLGKGARVMEVTFFRPYRERLSQTIRLSRASRDPVNLFHLPRCATDDGFLGIALAIPLAEKLVEEQVPLLDHEQYAGEAELAGLVERLRLRMGERTVGRAELVESHLPERAWRQEDCGMRISDCGLKRPSSPQSEIRIPQSRPLHLLHPSVVHVMVSPSEDDEGRPVLFRWGRGLHNLRYAIGPERIAGEWWRGHHHTRDYFNVEDEQGLRFWLFRVRATRKWYVQGAFE